MQSEMTKEEFKAIRVFLGETQEAFAKRLGYKSFVTISYKETGARQLTQQDKMLLQEYLEPVRENIRKGKEKEAKDL